MGTLSSTLLLLVALIAGAVTARADPAEASLEAIRDQTAARLQNGTDFVCTELVLRARWNAGDPDRDPPSFEDALRLEVGVVGGKEVFGWPGDKGFEELSVVEMLGDGAFSTGDFLGHARALFGSRKGEVRFATAESGTTLRFDYRVSDFPTGYRVTTASGSAEALYGGSFWVDAASLDVRRLTVEANEIPAAVGILSIRTTIDYQTTRLASGDALLPTRAEIWTRYASGSTSHNLALFEDCRAFATSSSIRFGEGESETVGAAESAVEPVLAAGQGLFLRLRTPIEWGASRVGDLLNAELLRPAKTTAGVLAEGTALKLRLRRLQRRSEPQPFFVVGLALESAAAELESFTATGADVALVKPAEGGPATSSHREMAIAEDRRAGVSSFYVFGKSLRLRDARMRWRMSTR